jgi:hypothetical protein
MLVKVYFFGKGPGQGQIPGFLGHGPQIPDRTIDHCKATDHGSNAKIIPNAEIVRRRLHMFNLCSEKRYLIIITNTF